MSFVGASNNRMFADWATYIEEPSHVWCREFRTLAARAEDLVSNDPFAAAMVAAKLNGERTQKPRSVTAPELLFSGLSLCPAAPISWSDG